jgi:hypothetical protein
VEAATNPTLSTSIISDETPEADGEGDGELLPSMDIFSGIKSLNAFFYIQFQTKTYYVLKFHSFLEQCLHDLQFMKTR